MAHRDAVSERDRKDVPRGVVVELVRLILVAAFAVGGWQIAEAAIEPATDLSRFVGIVLGSAIGFVVGGVLGRRTATAVQAVELEFRTVPASELLAGTIGLILGLVIAVLASILLFRLPMEVAAPTVAFVAVTLAYAGYRLGRSKRDEFFQIFGLRSPGVGAPPGEIHVLDTSALIDGRIVDVVEAGFLGGTFLLVRGVLDELRSIADSSDPQRRTRGQRGLKVLHELQRSGVEVVLVDEQRHGDVDGQLVRLAKERGGDVVTCDSNLAKVAVALDVPVRSMHELAVAVRPPFTPGEEFAVHLSREGRDHGQGVGYLEDGTMVVVEGGRPHLGSEVEVTVTNVLQTPQGRMVFARLRDG
jgi:uncharacterized protein YacL